MEHRGTAEFSAVKCLSGWEFGRTSAWKQVMLPFIANCDKQKTPYRFTALMALCLCT